MVRFLPIAALAAASVVAQTQVDLRTQSRNVDFSTATATKPAKTGMILPSSCSVGEMFFKSDAIPGENLHLCVGNNTWSAIQGGSSSGSGVSNASALADFQVTRLSPGTLSIGSGCSLSTPCVVSWGSRSVSLTTPASLTLTAGTGVAYIYVSFQGALTVAHNMTLACNGCQTTLGTSFPSDSVPIATWSSTLGIWDLNGGLDMRGFIGNKPVTAGFGILSTDVNGASTISADSSVLATRVTVPLNATSNCSTGSYAIDTAHLYVCAATNTWRRAAVTTW